MNQTKKVKHINRVLIQWIGMLFAVVYLVSCESSEEPVDREDANRVFLVYLGGDNSLSGETYQKLAAIKEGLPPGGSKVLIYHDPTNATPVLTEITNRNGQTLVDTIAVYEEENSASATVFARVVNEVREKYPAATYGLLVFSHASGWLPPGALNNPGGLRSVIIDGNAEMEIVDFARAIPDGTFDCIVFEACFMAGIEVAYELKDKTGYILASSAEIVSPGFTEIYPGSLGLLLDGHPEAFAEQAFAYFADHKTVEMRSATFSVIKTAGLQALATFISENCRLEQTVNILTVQHFDRKGSYRLFFDFEDYYSRLLDSNEQGVELQRLVNDCVIWKAATPSFLINYNGFRINCHSGLTVYIPQESFPALNTRYDDTKWRKALFNFPNFAFHQKVF